MYKVDYFLVSELNSLSPLTLKLWSKWYQFLKIFVIFANPFSSFVYHFDGSWINWFIHQFFRNYLSFSHRWIKRHCLDLRSLSFSPFFLVVKNNLKACVASEYISHAILWEWTCREIEIDYTWFVLRVNWFLRMPLNFLTDLALCYCISKYLSIMNLMHHLRWICFIIDKLYLVGLKPTTSPFALLLQYDL